MSQIIIYKQDTGIVAVIHPAAEAVAMHGIAAIAQKDVPAGKSYKIIAASELPNRAERGQWTVDNIDLTDGVGSVSNEFGA